MLKLKLDMVYHGLSVDEARVRFAELSTQAPVVPPPVVEPPKRRRRVIAAA